MESGEVIYQDDTYHIVKKSSFSDELVELFDTTSWGETGALYEHKDTRKRLEELQRPTLLEVRKEDDLVGCCVFVGRTTYCDEKSYETNFVRYLVANPKYRGQGLMTQYAIHTMDSVRKDALPGTLYVGTVETFNKSSYNLVQAVEYKHTHTIQTMSYSRPFPKKDRRVRKATTPDEKNKITKQLWQQYGNHSLYHQENIFKNDDYYYIEEAGKIIAGVQCFPALWVIKKVPGLAGTLMMHILPHIPVLNKMFNPRKFEFLAFEGIIYDKDRMGDLHKLFSHVIATFGLKTSLFWLDEKDALYDALQNYGKLGLVQKAGAATGANIMISFTDVPKGEEERIAQSPTYQAGFDFI